MLIGILQCGHAPDDVQSLHGDFDTMFSALLQGYGFNFKTWNVVDDEFPTSPTEADGWLITGSKHGVYEEHAFIASLSALITEIYTSARPMVGVCFGHQMIAKALGGTVKKFDGGWAIGRQGYTFGAHGAITLNAWHQDQVITLPPDANVIAESDFCKFSALVYEGNAYSIQPHPEFSNPVFSDYVSARRDSPAYPADLMERAEQATNIPIQDGLIADDIASFFKGTFKPEVLV